MKKKTVKRIKAIRHLFFSFRGRLSLPMWWLAKGIWLAYVFVSLLLGVLLGEIGELVNSEDLFVGIAWVILLPSWIWSSTVLNIKRFHDRNMSGWLLVVGLIPLIGFIFNFVHLAILSGDLGANEYGDPPPQSLKAWLDCQPVK